MPYYSSTSIQTKIFVSQICVRQLVGHWCRFTYPLNISLLLSFVLTRFCILTNEILMWAVLNFERNALPARRRFPTPAFGNPQRVCRQEFFSEYVLSFSSNSNWHAFVNLRFLSECTWGQARSPGLWRRSPSNCGWPELAGARPLDAGDGAWNLICDFTTLVCGPSELCK